MQVMWAKKNKYKKNKKNNQPHLSYANLKKEKKKHFSPDYIPKH